jgi:CBS domain containing-hemolysin-like protein
VEPRDELTSAHTVEELAVLVSVSHDEGAIPDFAAELLAGVLDFAGRDVASVMVPREACCAIPSTSTVAEAEATIRDEAHTRVPVFGEGGIDDILGFIHSKDLLTISESDLDRPIPPRLVRRMLVVPRDQSLEELLLSMQSSRVHFALVTEPDESTAGIVTLDDLLEELVGDITENTGAVDRTETEPPTM